MNKRLICILLVFLMCFSLAPLAFASGDENTSNVGVGDPWTVPDPKPDPVTYTKTEKTQEESTGVKKDPPPPAAYFTDATTQVKTQILGNSVLEGLRFTLYFFEDAKSYSDMYDDPVEGRLYSKAVNLGNIDLIWTLEDEYFSDKVYWSGYDIYQRMGDWAATNAPYKMGLKEVGDGDGMQCGNYLKEQAVGVENTNAGVAIKNRGGDTIYLEEGALEKIKDIYSSDKSGTEKSNNLNLFFVGNKEGMGLSQATEYVEKINNGDPVVLDYNNTCLIAQKCLEKVGIKDGLNFDNINGSFIYGFYTDADGITHNGVLKLYYEPLTAFNIEGDTFSSPSNVYVFTLHDLIAYSNANSTKQILTEQRTYTYRLKTEYFSGLMSEHYTILEEMDYKIYLIQAAVNLAYDELSHCASDEDADYWNRELDDSLVELENWKTRRELLAEHVPLQWVQEEDGRWNIKHDFNGDGKPDYIKSGDPVIEYIPEDFSEAFRSIYYYMANYTFLVSPEPTLRMTGVTQGPWYTNGTPKAENVNVKYDRTEEDVTKRPKFSQIYNAGGPYTYSTMMSSERPAQSSTIGKMFNSMGIGVVTSLNGATDAELIKGPKPQVIKTYVRIKSVDKDGNVTFEKAKNTDIGTLAFAEDSSGKLTNYPLIDTNIDEESTGLSWALNDILTSPFAIKEDNGKWKIEKGLDVEIATSEWTDNIQLLHNQNKPIISDGVHNGYSLEKTSDVINGSYLDIIFKSKTFTDLIAENEGLDIMPLYNAGIRKVVSELYSSTTNKLIKPITNIDSQHLDIVTKAEAQTGYTFPAVDLSAFYGHYSDEINNNKCVINTSTGEILTAGIISIIDEIKSDKEDVYSVILDKEHHIDTLTQFKVENEDKTPVNTVILRYVEYMKPKQINIIEYQNNDGSVAGYASGGIVDLKKDGNTVTIQDPVGDFKDAIPVEFVTNYEIPLYVLDESNPDLPEMSNGGLTDLNEDGLDRTITNYPQGVLEHNLYVKWVVMQPYVAVPVDVPEWRLSRFWNAFSEKVGQTEVGISFKYNTGDCTTHTHTLTPTGNFLYDAVTEKTDGAERLIVDTWLRGEFIHSSYVPNITNDPTSDLIPVSADMLGVKSTATAGLKTATWVNNNTIDSKYKIGSASTGTP